MFVMFLVSPTDNNSIYLIAIQIQNGRAACNLSSKDFGKEHDRFEAPSAGHDNIDDGIL
jgi:hypothetical protein